MKLSPILLALTALSFASAVQAAPALPPAIVKLQPNYVIAGGGQFMITVNAHNLEQGTTVRWNGTVLATHRTAVQQVIAIVPAADIAAAATVSITLADAAGTSSAATFTVIELAPVVTGIQPASITAGILTVRGSHFVSSSVIVFDGVSMPTSFVNASTLTTNLSQAMIDTGQSANISVFSPPPGGGSSNVLQIAGVNPLPVLSTVSPNTFDVYEGSISVFLTGSGFMPGTTVYWNGTALSTRYASQNSVTAMVPASLFATVPSMAPIVTAVNPSPGGGVSGALTVTENCNPPVLRGSPLYSVPLDITASAAEQSVQIYFAGVVPLADMSALWNGSSLTVQSASTLYGLITAVTVLVPATDVVGGGTAEVTVADVCGSSAPLTADITIPTPAIASVSPGGAFGIVGSSSVTLTLTGSGFLPGATVSLDGSSRATTYVSSSEVQATLTASDVATMGSHALTAINTGIGATDSAAYNYTVGYSVTDISSLTVGDLVWDPVRQVFYAGANVTSATFPNSIVTIDPLEGQVIASQAVSPAPDVLAISDDGSYLYGASENGTVQRYTLPSLTLDISWSLGTWRFLTNYAEAISTVPGAPHALTVDVKPQGMVAIYDDGVERANTSAQYAFLSDDVAYINDSIGWKPDGSGFFMGDFSSTGGLYDFGVDSSGISLIEDYPGIIPTTPTLPYVRGVHFDAATGYVFTDNGEVIDPSDGAVITKLTPPPAAESGFPTGVALDDTSGLIYMGYIVLGNEVLVSYDLYSYAMVNTITIPVLNIVFQPLLTRWGLHGLALTNRFGDIYILQGDFVQ